jgi:hypothetical protein
MSHWELTHREWWAWNLHCHFLHRVYLHLAAGSLHLMGLENLHPLMMFLLLLLLLLLHAEGGYFLLRLLLLFLLLRLLRWVAIVWG